MSSAQFQESVNHKNNPGPSKADSASIRRLSPLNVWALSFGCIIGWGAFVMPGTTFLPEAGVAGTAAAMVISSAIMLLIGFNFYYMIRINRSHGGAYAFTHSAFGYEMAFLCSWFLCLAYLSVIPLNATALSFIGRMVFPELFQSSIHYSVAGYEVYPGDILLSEVTLLIFGLLIAFRQQIVKWVQTVLSLIIVAGVLILLMVFLSRGTLSGIPPARTAVEGGLPLGILSVILISPWAFVGFDTVALFTNEARFPLRKMFGIIASSIIAGGLAYTALTLIAAAPYYNETAAVRESYGGLLKMPIFQSAEILMGRSGVILLCVTALAAILTGIIGFYQAAGRMLCAMSEGGILPRGFSSFPFSIMFIMCISFMAPFFGRTALGWIVEMSTFGAIVGFAFTSAAAYRTACVNGHAFSRAAGLAGTIISGVFILVSIVPGILPVEPMAPQSYLVLSLWSVTGYFFYWHTMNENARRSSDMENINNNTSIVAGICLFFLIFLSSMVWTTQTLLQMSDDEQLRQTLTRTGLIQTLLVLAGLTGILNSYNRLRKIQMTAETHMIRAEEKSRAKSMFLFNMSHDLRTPLNALMGYTYLARQGSREPEELMGYLEKIDMASSQLLTLVNDILEMSRIENGRMELYPERCNLHILMTNIRDLFSKQMEDKHIEYVVEDSDLSHSEVMCDGNHFARVLTNLVSNALKFTPEGGRVNVSLSEARFNGLPDNPEAEYILKVRDNGIGISPEFIGRVFDVFERERTSTVSRIQGTGLGMSITKRIVEQMGGTIEVDSRQGEWTEFTIHLPLPVIQGEGPEDGAENRTADAAAEPEKTAKPASDSSQTRFSSSEGAGDEGGAEAAAGTDGAGERERFEIRDRAEAEDDKPAAAAEEEREREAQKKTAAAAAEDKTGTKAEEKSTAAAETAETAEENTAAADGEDEDPALVGAGKRILMAEDNEINQEIAIAILEEFGFETEAVENGREAVDRLISAPEDYFDLILMDIQMPVMDGYEATAAIRALDDPVRSSIPIIAATANTFDEDIRRAREEGMDAHIAKPLSIDIMISTIEDVLRKSSKQALSDLNRDS